MSIDEEPFILVTSKRQKSKNSTRSCVSRNRQHFLTKNIHLSTSEDSKTFDKAAELRKIADSTRKVENSEYFKQSIDILSKQSPTQPTRIVCFGIGQIRHCHISRYQLAYILALRSYLKIESIEFHEPLLSHHDTDLLNTLSCELFSSNIEGKLSLDSTQTTIVFLPHCPKQLINNLLWKNWSADALRHLILISNSFHSIVQQTPFSCIDQDAGFISRIEPYTIESSLRNSFEHKNVFNDIAIHFFNTQNLEENILFDICLEPSYDISELIEATDNINIG